MPVSTYFKITETITHYLIISNIDSTGINKVIKINNSDPNFNVNNVGNESQYTFTLNKSNYNFIYGNRYNITINLLNTDTPPKMISSNTIVVKADIPSKDNKQIMNNDSVNISQNIIDTLKNKTFDIYI